MSISFRRFDGGTASPLAQAASRAMLELGPCLEIHTYPCLRSPYMLTRRYCRNQDCRDVEDFVARTFSPPDGSSGLIVYVGQRPEYVTPLSPLASIPISQERGRCLTKQNSTSALYPPPGPSRLSYIDVNANSPDGKEKQMPSVRRRGVFSLYRQSLS
jgi:hypothetical protein